MTIILTILTTIIVAIIAFYIFNKRQISALELNVKTYTSDAEDANTKLEELIAPTHLFSDAEYKNYKKKYNVLYKDIVSCCRNRHFSNCTISTKTILHFKRNYEKLHFFQEENNENYYLLENIDFQIESAYKRTVDYFLDKDYLTESRRIKYEIESNEINQLLEEADARNLLDYSAYSDKCKSVLTAHLESTERKEENNDRFISKQLIENAHFFDTILKHPLNEQQREAIVTLEDNVLTISAAGSGKTSTIEGKVKYLVEKRGIDPQKILLITYTRKAAESLTERLNLKGLSCLTFHKLASNIIEKSKGYKPTFCEANIFPKIYEELKQEASFKNAINTYVLSYQSQMKDEFEYKDAKTYYADRKKYGILALFPDADGNLIYTKSEQERKICHFLSMNGIKFRYEEPYLFEEYEPGYRIYKPDFTIYFNKDGKEKKIYLEHFGVDENGNVPIWFGDGKDGGWMKANFDYNKGIIWKRNTHKEHKTILLETTSAQFANGNIYKSLLFQLKRAGVPIRPLSDDDLYKRLVSDNSKKEKTLINLISSFINLLKANCIPTPESILPEECEEKNDIRNKYIIDNIISPFFIKYQTVLAKRGEMDFTDAILKARDICNDGFNPDYDYILVDEFQDISTDRYEFLKSLRRDDPQTRLFCVGDDWQSIYRFAGSNMALFNNFETYFGYTKECKMETTFRFGEPLISISSDFILKNPEQKEKVVTPYSDKIKTELKTLYYNNIDDYRKMIISTLSHIPAGKSVYILGRYSFDADILKSDEIDIYMKGDKTYIKCINKEYPYLTAHQSKGLEADYVLLLNCNSGAYGFPSTISDDPIMTEILSEEDYFEFGEERRLFYVAITRAKRMTYIFYDKKHPSIFISEIEPDVPLSERCPVCQDGRKMMVHSGVAKNGSKFYTYICSNNTCGCDYRQTFFANDKKANF